MTMTVTVNHKGKVEIFSDDPALPTTVRFSPPVDSMAGSVLRDAVFAKSWSEPEVVGQSSLVWDEVVSAERPHVALFGDRRGVWAADEVFEASFQEAGGEVIFVESFAGLTKAIRGVKEANHRASKVRGSVSWRKPVMVVIRIDGIEERESEVKVDQSIRALIGLIGVKKVPWSVVICAPEVVPSGEQKGAGSWVFPGVRPMVAIGEDVVWSEIAPMLRLTDTEVKSIVQDGDRWIHRGDRGAVICVQ